MQIFLIILFFGILYPQLSLAADSALDGCINAIFKAKSGKLIQAESLSKEGSNIIELELKDKNGQNWEYTCDLASVEIIETESKVSSPQADIFKKSAKINKTDAINTALDSYPGDVKEIEYEIKSDGKPTYEIDIYKKEGKETKVEVDAITGKITAVYLEKWEIGLDSKE